MSVYAISSTGCVSTDLDRATNSPAVIPVDFNGVDLIRGSDGKVMHIITCQTLGVLVGGALELHFCLQLHLLSRHSLRLC